jgi:hypothetical protein
LRKYSLFEKPAWLRTLYLRISGSFDLTRFEAAHAERKRNWKLPKLRGPGTKGFAVTKRSAA